MHQRVQRRPVGDSGSGSASGFPPYPSSLLNGKASLSGIMALRLLVPGD
jgi:hypothetical protein